MATQTALEIRFNGYRDCALRKACKRYLGPQANTFLQHFYTKLSKSRHVNILSFSSTLLFSISDFTAANISLSTTSKLYYKFCQLISNDDEDNQHPRSSQTTVYPSVKTKTLKRVDVESTRGIPDVQFLKSIVTSQALYNTTQTATGSGVDTRVDEECSVNGLCGFENGVLLNGISEDPISTCSMVNEYEESQTTVCTPRLDKQKQLVESEPSNEITVVETQVQETEQTNTQEASKIVRTKSSKKRGRKSSNSVQTGESRYTPEPKKAIKEPKNTKINEKFCPTDFPEEEKSSVILKPKESLVDEIQQRKRFLAVTVIRILTGMACENSEMAEQCQEIIKNDICLPCPTLTKSRILNFFKVLELDERTVEKL